MGLNLLGDITSILPNGGGILGGILGNVGSGASSSSGGLLNLGGGATTATKSLASQIFTSPAFWMAGVIVVLVLVK